MFKRAIVGLASVAVLGSGMAAAAPASADHDAYTPYVTKAEFRTVKVGWGIKGVHHYFDTRGRQDSYYSEGKYCDWKNLWDCAEQSRSYPTRSRWGTVYVDYVRTPRGRWVVTSKSAYW
jgi:hypothetical protein